MHEDAVIFGLAGTGYVLLAKDTALRIAGRRWPVLAALTALVVSSHVVLVWLYRFEGSLQAAWQKSPAGFLIFHTAFVLIAAAPFVRGRARDHVTWAAFGIVSAGALPAPFRYEEVAVLAIPLLAAFAAVVAVWIGTRRPRAGA